MQKLKIGIIGAGYIGGLHTRIAAEHPCAQLVAVSDIDLELARSFAAAFNCAAYGDTNEMLEHSKLDAVVISVPEHAHVAAAVLAANAKKHILLEKPIALTAADGRTIQSAAKKNDVRLMVAHVLKFDPRYTAVGDAIAAGQLGDITSLFFRRLNARTTPKRLRGATPIFFYIGVHDVEYMLDYNRPAKPLKVYCQGSARVNADLNELDTVVLVVTFDNGSIGTVELSWALPENPACGISCEVQIIGSKAIANVRIGEQNCELITEDAVLYPDTRFCVESNGKLKGDLPDEVDHFIQCVLENKAFAVNTDNAIAAVAVIEAAQKSMETGGPVDL